MRVSYLKILFLVVIVILLGAKAPAFWGLLCGLVFSLTLGSPFENSLLAKFHKPLLQCAIVGLGFGMNIGEVLSTGIEGLGITLLTLLLIIFIGTLLAKRLKLDSKLAFLISSGTAICGGSAIAALSPIVGAKNKDISMALGVVFLLNAVALITFPVIGRLLHLTEVQFAWFSAIAIHDTSSVVGAASQFGDKSLALATTIKLTRALWIVPFSLVAASLFYAKDVKTSFPYFILYFLIAALLASYIPPLRVVTPAIIAVSKGLFTVVLFLIGMGVNKNMLKEMGTRSVVHGSVLWLASIIISIGAVFTFICSKQLCDFLK